MEIFGKSSGRILILYGIGSLFVIPLLSTMLTVNSPSSVN